MPKKKQKTKRKSVRAVKVKKKTCEHCGHEKNITKCPECKTVIANSYLNTTKTDRANNQIVRYRECKDCGTHYSVITPLNMSLPIIETGS